MSRLGADRFGRVGLWLSRLDAGLGASIGALLVAALPSAAMAETLSLDSARLMVEQASRPSAPWGGPTTGPPAQPGKTVAVLSGGNIEWSGMAPLLADS